MDRESNQLTSLENNTSDTDFDIDSLFEDESAFKPITEGLGFHQEKKEFKQDISVKERSRSLKIALDQKKSLKTKTFAHENNKQFMGELSAFYNSDESKLKESPVEKLKPVVKFQQHSSYLKRSFAFCIDFLIVNLLFLVFFAFIYKTSGLRIESVKSMSSLFLTSTFLPVWLCFYLFYFSLLEKSKLSTIGKYLCKMKVLGSNRKEPSLLQTMFRSIVTLISLFLLTLPLLFDFQSKLSDTVVYDE